MGKIAEKAKFIDMYASLPRLSFGKDGKVYSRLGLLLTFLTIVIIGGMAIWIGISVFGRHKPSFIQYQLPAQDWNPTIPRSPDDFKFGLAPGKSEWMDTLTSVKPSYWNPQGYQIPVTVETCTFAVASAVTFNCFAKRNSQDKSYLDAKGEWEFSIDYEYCTGSDCDPDPQGMLEQEDFVFVYEDLVIDPFNYENPITSFQALEAGFLLLGVGRTLVVELNEVIFTSDNGWIFEDLKTERRLKATTSIQVSDATIFRLQIKYGGNKTVYKRTYPKIQDFLAQVSGLITVITPIFLILVAPYINLRAVQQMINEIYEIKLNKPPKDGDSPQKFASASKKVRRSSKLKYNSTSAKETQGNLLPKRAAKVKSKSEVHLPSLQSKSFPFAPHAALVIGGVGEVPIKEEIPPVAEESSSPLHFHSLGKSPSSPFRFPSLKSRDQDENSLISPRKILLEHAKTSATEAENEKLSQNLEPLKPKEEIESQNPASEESESEYEEEEVPLRTSDHLEVPWQDWLMSFWKPSPEVQVLYKAKEHIMETFDLVTLSKKVIEIDKLKACLFTHDQRVIFENLPSSVIVRSPGIDIKSPEAVKQYHWKDSFKGDEVALKKAYIRLKETKTQLDKLLIRLYESENIDDGASL